MSQLQSQGCSCDDWSNVEVAENFDVRYVRNVEFSGKIKLGCFKASFSEKSGIVRHSGVYNAVLHNCEVEDDVYINKIGNYIANYKIGKNSYIENVDLLAVDDETSFGNGVEVAVINEGGGREVPMYDHLTSSLAYIIALYRYRTEAVAWLCEQIKAYAKSVSSRSGVIGASVRIVNCGEIKNVKIGDSACLDGCAYLENGSINSNSSASVKVGVGVNAKDFIFCSGSEITDGAMIERSFVGQGSAVGKQFSATDVLFFANCQAFHGEAASLFAGPYTVTHHKSSLLIAGLFSFLNVGSGSNQSNHGYKFGPVHQGIVERGSKTTSDSYLLWPARIGAFTLIKGRHTTHPDTMNLPFSYLIEDKGVSYLAPAVNLRSVGTVRDVQKWPKRDNRKDPVLLDNINFSLLNPYTVGKIKSGIRKLLEIQQTEKLSNGNYFFDGLQIKESALERGLNLYKKYAFKYVVEAIFEKLKSQDFDSIEKVRKILSDIVPSMEGEWIDLGGMIICKASVEQILRSIEVHEYDNIENVNNSLSEFYKNYEINEWSWVNAFAKEDFSINFAEMTKADLCQLLDSYRQIEVEIDEMLLEDAQKDYAEKMRIGYGMGDDNRQMEDLNLVRGEMSQTSFVKDLKRHTEDVKREVTDFLLRINDLKD